MKIFIAPILAAVALSAQDPGPVHVDFGETPLRFAFGKEDQRLKAFRKAQWAKAQEFFRGHVIPAFQKLEAYERTYLRVPDEATTAERRSRDMMEEATAAEANGRALQNFLREYLQRIWHLETTNEDPASVNTPTEASKKAFQEARQAFLNAVAALDRLDVEEGRAMKGLPPTKKPSTN